MSPDSTWVRPTENSVEALEHGMRFVDGVELDLRLSTDGELMLWHDDLFEEKLPKTKDALSLCIVKKSRLKE